MNLFSKLGRKSSLFNFLNILSDKILFPLRYGWVLGDDLISFFYRALKSQKKTEKKGLRTSVGTYYEFGVGWGGTLIKYIKALKTYCSVLKQPFYSHYIFGFDSFEGLPSKKSLKDDLKRWTKGFFSHSLSEVKKKLIKQGIDLEKGNIRFIKGYFEETLTPELRKELCNFSPSIVTIDCDYYSSTKIVLEWLRLILNSGTLFYFDDIWSFCGHPEFGEIAAIYEFNDAGKG